MAGHLERVEQTNQELEMILDSVYDDILIADGQGVVLRASKSMESSYKLSIESIIGQSVFELERQKIFYPSVTARVIRERTRQSTIQESGSGKKFLVTGIPVFDDEGEIYRIVTYSHDVTELVELRALTAEMSSEMEKVRTELEQLQTRDAQLHGLIAVSHVSQSFVRTALQVSKHDVPVLLLGESGVGKGAFARFIHRASPRSDGPFIEINCGAIPESLVESELFGYEEGAFTGARRRGKPGLLELAENGTLFLDEIAELPLRVQVKLLHVIQDRQFIRVGGSQALTANFRLITATNRDLEQLVEDRLFRDDLYFRLNIVSLQIPPVRERKDDLVALTGHFLDAMNEKHGLHKSLSPAVLRRFLEYDWPGNVRELENLIERLVVLAEDDVIVERDLPPRMIPSDLLNRPRSVEALSLPERLEQYERELVADARRRAKTTTELAALLGVSQPTAVRKLHKYFPQDPHLSR